MRISVCCVTLRWTVASGCGKTFCMDLAYACLPGVDGKDKKREHFHSFMLATHHALHKLGKEGSSAAGSRDTVVGHALFFLFFSRGSVEQTQTKQPID